MSSIFQREVPRSKTEKAAIPGLPCRECDGWWRQSLEYATNEEERQRAMDHLHKCCKHRQNTIMEDGQVKSGVPKTPPDYWNMSFEVKNSLAYRKSKNKRKK